jgi:CDP-4-dehydro-6-deoxyglucose reductase, E3
LFCQFIPRQYVEVWIPDTEWLSHAYSIGNSPSEDGSIDLQIRRQKGGRFTTSAFYKMKIGDEISVRRPLGDFTLFSERETSLFYRRRDRICSHRIHD